MTAADIQHDGDVTIANPDHVICNLTEKVIDYAGVQVLLDEYIFSKLQITDEDTLGLLKWDIVEYYGLASLELDIDADFNPLASCCLGGKAP